MGQAVESVRGRTVSRDQAVAKASEQESEDRVGSAALRSTFGPSLRKKSKIGITTLLGHDGYVGMDCYPREPRISVLRKQKTNTDETDPLRRCSFPCLSRIEVNDSTTTAKCKPPTTPYELPSQLVHPVRYPKLDWRVPCLPRGLSKEPQSQRKTVLRVLQNRSDELLSPSRRSKKRMYVLESARH